MLWVLSNLLFHLALDLHIAEAWQACLPANALRHHKPSEHTNRKQTTGPAFVAFPAKQEGLKKNGGNSVKINSRLARATQAAHAFNRDKEMEEVGRGIVKFVSK